MRHYHIIQAINVLNAGGVIAYPTEAVFGLGCDPQDFNAVKKILSLKKRSLYKGMILIAADRRQIDSYIEYPDDKVEQQVNATWPGAVTWLLPAKTSVPYWITGYKDTVAVRVCAHPVVQSLCRRVGAVVSTSANPTGCLPALNATKVRAYFGSGIDYVIPGITGDKCLPTEIKNAVTGEILRFSD